MVDGACLENRFGESQRGFESLSLRHSLANNRGRKQLNTRGGAGVAERDRLLSDCRALNSTEGSNPSLPATILKPPRRFFC